MVTYTQNGELTAKIIQLGGIQRYGKYVSLHYEAGCYRIYRHPAHPNGHAVRAARTVTEARKIAKALA